MQASAFNAAEGKRPLFYYDFLSILDSSILPAVSMFESNPCIGEEVWETLKLYPYQARQVVTVPFFWVFKADDLHFGNSRTFAVCCQTYPSTVNICKEHI